jgi:enoyl-CoA hydratase/carnithine racemase
MTSHARVTTAERIPALRFDRPDKENALALERAAALEAATRRAAPRPGFREGVMGHAMAHRPA